MNSIGIESTMELYRNLKNRIRTNFCSSMMRLMKYTIMKEIIGFEETLCTDLVRSTTSSDNKLMQSLVTLTFLNLNIPRINRAG